MGGYLGGLRPLVQRSQELVGQHIEGVFVQGLPDNHHRVRPQNVHGYVGAEPGQIVYSDHRVWYFGRT
jgi:hypothetical protein